MKLLQDIIDSVLGTAEPTASILRKCLVLAYQLKNDRLKKWVESELNGYQDSDILPDYRKVQTVAKGLFLGGAGAEMAR